ncbi:hypothetical protein FB45DRAFT_993876 [Roridomyces roridus]|uniref:Uncharacterized protein n=1 Tax=Roridomyces roridus TaxID=1738132 RepID=A0AAD7B107_9AGAR|nr:hypothetical protein FB45DRAFT_993876 [Roridomyces roridus]
MDSQDELTATVFGAVQSLSHLHKANLLLDTALALINAGQYGTQVENYIEVYLRTPDLPRNDVVKALLARGNARKAGGESLLVKAEQDFRAVLKLDPSNREIQRHLSRQKVKIRFSHDPASQRAPAEVWERIASFIPRYHLRTWFFVSAFHRDVAVRLIFHTMDLYFGDDQEALNRGLDVFDRVKADPVFASRVKSLRLHWAYEEGDMLDLMARIFRSALPEFKALKDFEWIGYPELRADMVQTVLSTHSHLHGLGLIGWHFDAVGVSAFRNLRKFTLRAEDDDGFADMGEVRTVLDQNADTLRHLVLGAYLSRDHSWDSAFQSVTIKNLTHLDLVDTRISHVVLARIAHAHSLQSLTLHGTFEDPGSASVVFGSDHVLDGEHTFLPHLVAFRLVLVGHDDQPGLYRSVTQFLRRRTRLRRLDLGNCPWEMVLEVLPELVAVRVFGVRIENLTAKAVDALVAAIPREIAALHLSTVVSDRPLNDYAKNFSGFSSLAFLHLQNTSRHRPKPNLLSEKEFQLQTDIWAVSARSVATALPVLDFLGWHGEHYVVVRGGGEQGSVELKELPCRRHLDCGKGVDLGGEDAAWLERKDVPMDYEMPVEA